MADERGSIVSVTDSAGATLRINTYDEYGIPAAANLGRFQYTGQTWLPEAGLYHYKARMYSPTLGRFMQTDPIGYADGMNWYAYVGGDPVNFRDPLGLRQVCGNIDNSYTTIENGVSTQVVASRRVCYDLPDFGPIDFDPHGGPGGGDPNDPCGGRVIVDPIPGNTNLNPGNRQTSEGRGAFGTPRSRGSHSGIDITAEEGTPVVAVGNGIVVAVNPNPSSTYGNQVAIDLGGGIVPTYQHLQGPGVHRLGESVTSGDVIGRVGRTGNTPTGARTHLHFEIRVGSALARSQGGRVIDPETCLPGVYQ